MKKLAAPLIMLAIFETVAITLRLALNNIFYLLFSGVFEAATIHYAGEKCVSCGKCRKVCPMNVDMTDNSRKRANGTECILCLKCVDSCPQKAIKL